MAHDFDDSIVSDLHKDAYGFRPSSAFWADWTASTPDEKQATWDRLVRTMQDSAAEEKAAEQRAIASFEATVTKLAGNGLSREQVIRALDDANDCNGDRDYLCYKLGLPYGYLKACGHKYSCTCR